MMFETHDPVFSQMQFAWIVDGAALYIQIQLTDGNIIVIITF